MGIPCLCKYINITLYYINVPLTSTGIWGIWFWLAMAREDQTREELVDLIASVGSQYK